MPANSVDVIVVSPRGMVRELLADLLSARCGVCGVTRADSLDACLPVPASARVLICDTTEMTAVALEGFAARLAAATPRVELVTVDDASANIEQLISTVRGICARSAPPHSKLTPLELEVLLAIAAGLRNADIARRMRRSYKTVEKHRASLIRKLELRSVSQLTAYTIQHGLLKADAIIATRRG